MTEDRIKELIEEGYIRWLYEKVGLGTREYGDYWRVIKRLFKRKFISLVKNDDNRISDALALRRQFEDEYGYREGTVDNIFGDFTGCTMLEMMVAFAMRIQSDIMWDPDNEDRTPFWFWSMLRNAGLDLKACQDGYFGKDQLIYLENLLDRVINRTYTKTGNGSFFPVFKCRKDMRKTELWYQMQFWIGENYPI